jgi:hypothetical protein
MSDVRHTNVLRTDDEKFTASEVTKPILSFGEFTVETVEQQLGVTTLDADLFPESPTAPVPGWLPEWLARGTRLALLSEKSRSEFIVVPILLAARAERRPIRHLLRSAAGRRSAEGTGRGM